MNRLDHFKRFRVFTDYAPDGMHVCYFFYDVAAVNSMCAILTLAASLRVNNRSKDETVAGAASCDHEGESPALR